MAGWMADWFGLSYTQTYEHNTTVWRRSFRWEYLLPLLCFCCISSSHCCCLYYCYCYFCYIGIKIWPTSMTTTTKRAPLKTKFIWKEKLSRENQPPEMLTHCTKGKRVNTCIFLGERERERASKRKAVGEYVPEFLNEIQERLTICVTFLWVIIDAKEIESQKGLLLWSRERVCGREKSVLFLGETCQFSSF